ncbi:hypothetical protein FA95DRAFT_1565793 [Auriscalpium vulgare]|uniref:Uncharacterized protein n=1 Tax=Auriscalpium vulgare TaxID=40419 RepID=A0ACB8RAT2_9AGAM|nr:hypothetical protein FA95DRAFT_1565793 [Auriscalpium vulgare]
MTDTRMMEANPAHLPKYERSWLANQKVIEAAGYRLRPRYREGWKPSWARWRLPHSWFEDGQFNPTPTVMDATRAVDGKQVVLKLVPETCVFEEEMAKLFSAEPHRMVPQNHCIPLEDTLKLPDKPMPTLVYPRMRPYNDPRFRTFGEVVAFIHQIFEGIEYMHKLHIAHKDCTGQNIVLDPSGMYPDSFHPIKKNRTLNYHWFAKSHTRTQRPPRYYIIDFGATKYYDPADGPPLDFAIRGGDKTVPEFRNFPNVPPQNPFPTDIYYLGNMLRRDFVKKYYGFEFLESLVADMVQDDPILRPTINAALTTWKLRSRLVGRKDSFIVGPFRWIRHVYRTTGYIITRTPAVPMPRDEGQSRAHADKVE